VFSFHSVSVFMFTVYCLMDPCGLISNKDDDDDTISSVDVVVSFVINAAAYITGSVVIGVEKVTASVADKTSA